MRPEDVKQLYDGGYAAAYERKFLTSAVTSGDSAHEIKLLGELLKPESRWLDAACGTGYFLRQFPNLRRTGLDLSPAMLQVARDGNPDVELIEHDFQVPIPAWADRFDLVSCMWYAYSLVDTVAALSLVVDNLTSWTAPGGTCFVPLSDPVLITGVDLPYRRPDPNAEGEVTVTGILWSYSEEGGRKRHAHLVAPHVDFMVEMFQSRFEKVDLVRYPPTFPGWTGRPAIIATQKKPLHTPGYADRALA
jgi:SAM-dependent methyltransferase